MDNEIKIINLACGKALNLPSYTTPGSAGLDVRACITEHVVIAPGQTALIPTGFAIHIGDPNVMAILVPRSGLGLQGIVLGNTVGVIDSDYQGEVQVMLWNRKQPSCGIIGWLRNLFLDFFGFEQENDFVIYPGERICQMIFVSIVRNNWTLVEEFSSTTHRGTQGLGSTGLQ
jgi:dUTP pyrophosphatase